MPNARSGPATGPLPDITKAQGSTPYAQGWRTYYDAGWSGVVPIKTTWKGKPSDGKFPPATGYTGKIHRGVYPTIEQMQAWAANPAEFGNIALRLPDGVVGIDVDAYGNKHGDETMANLVQRFGELPPTWRSSSRGLDPDEMAGWDSGIYWFRTPTGLVWPGKLGDDVEIISHGYRYAVVWPSIHPSGRTYRWWNLDDDSAPDLPVDEIPTPDDFPHLPMPWTTALTNGKRHGQAPQRVVCMGEARRWLTSGVPCQAVMRALDGFDGASRRESMLKLQISRRVPAGDVVPA